MMNSNKTMKNFEQFAQSNFGISNTAVKNYMDNQSKYIEPTIVEERPMNVATMSVYSRLFMDRILILGSEVDSDSANILIAQMMFLDSISHDDIKLWINSPGGSVSAGLAICNVMDLIKSDVQTIGMGMCASMGSVILSNGTKGKRSVLPDCEVMIHQPLGGTEGQCADIQIAAKQIERCKNRLYQILSENSGQSVEKITADADRNFWMYGQEAVEYGLVDKVISRS